MKRLFPCLLATSLTLLLVGCGGEVDRPQTSEPSTPEPSVVVEREAATPEESSSSVAETLSKGTPGTTKPIETYEELVAAMKAKNPKFDGEVVLTRDRQGRPVLAINDAAIEDISPLAGLPMQVVDLSLCHISDISPLKGMPLVELYLVGTAVTDLTPLEGMPLEVLYLEDTPVKDLGPLSHINRFERLNLIGTKATDLSPLKNKYVNTLWLTRCPVRDISPLATMRIESVTLADTRVSDLTPLKSHGSLLRLHIADSDVTDLTILEWLPNLDRLIFTPSRIKNGIETVRKLPALRQLDTEFPPPAGRQTTSPAGFWARYDAGDFQ